MDSLAMFKICPFPERLNPRLIWMTRQMGRFQP